MASPTGGDRRPDNETAEDLPGGIALQLDEVKKQIEDVRGYLIRMVDALHEVVDAEKRELTDRRYTRTQDPIGDHRTASFVPPEPHSSPTAGSPLQSCLGSDHGATSTTTTLTTSATAYNRELDQGVPDDHFWPRYAAKMKQEAMYVLRSIIRGNEKSVDEGYKAVNEKLEPFPPSLMDEALLARDMNRGMSLLSCAAQAGNRDWFLHLLQRIRQKFGVSVLVKELKASDINGAPLLFQAASSRTRHECFDTVCYALRTILTRSGLIEQIIAFDQRGRNLMMHAARGNHVQVFKQVEAICERFCPNQPHRRDYTGRTILHHAAEAGCSAILQAVLDSLDDTEFLALNKADENGRTPIMHVLRLRHGYEGDHDLKEQFKMLYERIMKCGGGGWMERRRVLHPEEVRLGQTTVEAATELMHAARGGRESLHLVIDKFAKNDGGFPVCVDKVLNVTYDQESSPTSAAGGQIGEQAWGWGMLLASALRGGHVDVLDAVVYAIKTGEFAGTSDSSSDSASKPDEGCRDGDGGVQEVKGDDYPGGEVKLEGTQNSDSRDTERERMKRVKQAVDAIIKSGRSIYTLAVVSGKKQAVEWVDTFVGQHFDKDEVWEIVRGKYSQTSPITCAAAASVGDEDHGLGMFDTVFDCVVKAARNKWDTDLVKSNLKVSKYLSAPTRGSRISPLAASAFRSNWVLFQEIYDRYESRTGGRWSRENIWEIFREGFPDALTGGEHTAMHEHKRHLYTSFESQRIRLSAVMWRELIEAYERADTTVPSNDDIPNTSRREAFKSYSRNAVKLATANRSFDNLRDLVREGFPLHDDDIPELLLHIEDDEEDVIRIVTFAVGNASNPFVMATGVSKKIALAEREAPMHREGLRRLQSIIDDLTNELLEKLPKTVRGMGMTLLKPIFRQDQPVSRNGELDAAEQRRRGMLSGLAGFIAVEWILTPHLIIDQPEFDTRSYEGPAYTDPLSYALERGSGALKFINSPLVLDYVHIKFSCSLPHWASAHPFPSKINQGFYKYRNFGSGRYKNGETRQHYVEDNNPDAFLQGWDHHHMRAKLNGEEGDEATQQSSKEPQSRRSDIFADFPHVTLLPGLQFSLAGILGKPQTFYEAGTPLFLLKLHHILVFLGLFCSSVILDDSDRIPLTEVAFYVFVAGTLWRELLEFVDGFPGRLPPQGRRQAGRSNRTRVAPEPLTPSGTTERTGDSRSKVRGMGRLAIAARRYVGNDTWNVLDALTVVCVLVAFIARLLAMPRFGGPSEPAGSFFLAQFFLAASAPLFFARLLLLPQIDGTLGPMTQIIWKMLSQTLRFSVFLVIFMASFALSFQSLFHGCDNDSMLGESFGHFHQALVVVFGAPLGDFSFHELFDEAADQCPDHPASNWVGDAGTLLLVAYLVVMAVILFNLLIAILSTAHFEVHKNGEQEFHAARARLIVQSARAVARRRIAPPLNLLQIVPGLLVDAAGELWWLMRYAREGIAPSHEPWTSSFLWYTLEAFLQRVWFALTMGSAAVLVSAVLWTISLPLVTWNIVRWIAPKAIFRPFADEKPQVISMDNPEVTKRWGYMRSTAFLVVSITAWAAVSILGVFQVVVCIGGSILLWLRGLIGLFFWGLDEWGRRHTRDDFPTPMPGQEEGSKGADSQEWSCWREAWQSVVRNRATRKLQGQTSAHFHVGSLLQSTTGLDLEQLGVAVLEKEERMQRE
ncbi:unnamed protein product, partial [Scytosiphon promiscuus]